MTEQPCPVTQSLLMGPRRDSSTLTGRWVKERPATHFLAGEYVYTTDIFTLPDVTHSILLSCIPDSEEEGDWKTMVIDEEYFHRRVPADNIGGQIPKALEVWFFKCTCSLGHGL